MSTRAARPAEAVLRELVGERLEQGLEALGRAEQGCDPEGLHDFRVASRRLRTLFELFPDIAPRRVTRRALACLSRIGSATGAARDAEVQREWLDADLRGARSRSLRSARDALLESIDRRQEFGRARGLSQAAPEFRNLREALEGWLATEPGESRASFGEATGRCVAEAVAAIEHGLRSVHSPDDEAEAHEARIAAKRVRYALEPLRAERASAAAAVKEMKGLQNLLGEVNDLRTLRGAVRAVLERTALRRAQLRAAAVEARTHGDESADARDAEVRQAAQLETGCTAVLTRIEERRAALFVQLERDWAGARLDTLLTSLFALVRELLDLGEPQLEVERKYLLRALPELPESAEAVEIDQGYLGEGALRERVRRTRSAAGERYFRTLKLGRGTARVEFEQPLSKEQFEALWPQTAGCRVRKRRHRVREPSGTWEVDEFLDRDLVLAEIEFEPEGGVPPQPAWLAPEVQRDVTEESAYANLNLARQGQPKTL